MEDDIKDCIKWIIRLIKDNQQELAQDLENAKVYPWDDCKDFYDTLVVQRKAKIETLIEVKIGLEKYRKKLMYTSHQDK